MAVRSGACRAVPIGPPVANTRVFVLDEWLCPVPAGVAGELYVAGAGLARGYLGRAGLTGGAVRRVPVRGPAGSGCTGPGTWPGGRPDGELVFAGRADDQVKIRGFRVEPGEVEAVLAACPGVAQAVVIAREDDPGRPAAGRLRGPRPTARAPVRRRGWLAAAVREFAAARLPEYMVPVGGGGAGRAAADCRTGSWTGRRCPPRTTRAAAAGPGPGTRGGGAAVRGCSPRCWAWTRVGAGG